MKDSDIKTLEADGWTVECESPFEIRHEETESFASGTAAYYVLDALVSAEEREKRLIEELAQRLVDGINVIRNEHNDINTVLDFGCMGIRTMKALIQQIYNIFKDKGVI